MFCNWIRAQTKPQRRQSDSFDQQQRITVQGVYYARIFTGKQMQ